MVAGLVLEFTGFQALGTFFNFFAIALMFISRTWHDRRHLRRGEAPHMMWGTGDKRRPQILGGPRV
jgi:hypothetical protein